MVTQDDASDQTVDSRRPSEQDIRVNPLTFNRGTWPFAIPFMPDPIPGRNNYATVACCMIPADFPEFDGAYDAMCVETHEPLVLLGYQFWNGLFLDPLDERVLIGKEFH